MDIHPNDKGYNTMVFKLTSPTLQKTLKICVGKPYDEGGRDKYNVYLVSDDNVVVKRIGYYLQEKDSVVMEDGDFPIMKIGEPMWENMDVKVPAPEKKEAPPVVSKSDFIVINNDASGDCFYDAMKRGLNNTADTYSGEQIVQLRRQIGEYISTDEKMRQTILEKYDSYRKTKLPRLNQVDGYKEYYQRVDDEGEDEDDVLEDVLQRFPLLDQALIMRSKGDDFFPTKSEEDIIYLLTEYFDKRTDLKGDEVIATFVKNVNTPKKWVVEDIIAAFQEMANVQVVPMIKSGSKVEDYTISDVIPKEVLMPTTKYIFAAYQKLTHFQLIVRASDKKGAFVQSELPAVLKRKVSEYPPLAKLGEVRPKEAEVTSKELEVAPVVTREEAPPGAQLLDDVPAKAPKVPKASKPKVPVSKLDVIQLNPPDDEGRGTRKIVDDSPPITEEEMAQLQTIKKGYDAYLYVVEKTAWGKHFTDKGYTPFTKSTQASKTETISTPDKILLTVQNRLEPSLFFTKMKKAATEKKKD
jgi:hypothetical protein